MSEWVRGLRSHLGISQHALAGHIGVSRATVNRWERGHTEPEWPQRQLLNQLAKEHGYAPIPRRFVTHSSRVREDISGVHARKRPETVDSEGA